jgi:hypothetical protein
MNVERERRLRTESEVIDCLIIGLLLIIISAFQVRQVRIGVVIGFIIFNYIIKKKLKEPSYYGNTFKRWSFYAVFNLPPIYPYGFFHTSNH